MPQCGCFHRYDLKSTGLDSYELEVAAEGTIKLTDIIENAGLADSVALQRDFFSLARRYDLLGVRDERRLRDCLDLLTSVMMIELDGLSECYALGPYTVFDDEQRAQRSALGNLMNSAKYHGSISSLQSLRTKLQCFISQHPRLRNVDYIASPPKSDPTTVDVAGRCANTVARDGGYGLVTAAKVRETAPQKEDSQDNEKEAAARVAHSVEIGIDVQGAGVLVIDDTVRSGGTIREMARELRVAGADVIFALSIAKDAKFTLGGVSLSQEQWL